MKGGSRYLKVIVFFVVGGYCFFEAASTKNEADKIAKRIAEDVVVVSDFNEANDGKLVFVTGTVTTEEVLTDTEFGISVQAVKLKRTVERYSIVQDSCPSGNSKTGRRYNSYKRWLNTNSGSKIIDNLPDVSCWTKNVNATQSKEFNLKKVILRGYVLDENSMNKISGLYKLRINNLSAKVSELFCNKIKLYDGYYYLGNNPASPGLGDVRIYFQTIPLQLSIISQQSGMTLVPYKLGTGQIELIKPGICNLADMLKLFSEGKVKKIKLYKMIGGISIFVGVVCLFILGVSLKK
jgi:hypothetical protein